MLPLFMVKKEVFQWIKTGKKTIELRKGKAKSGDQAVFQCGRNILRGKIVRKEEGTLLALLQSLNKIFVQQNTSEPKVKVFVPMYEPLETSKCEKCGKIIAEPRELIRIQKATRT